MAAMLGIHWREFDRVHNSYYAEGNGIVLRGTQLDNFEIVFSINMTGKQSFTSNRTEGSKLAHVFPVAFEVLGMMCESLYISGSWFRTLPNPTMFTWPKYSFSIHRLLATFLDSVYDQMALLEGDWWHHISK
ncbi:hypothetical protein B0H63DRAFT_455091 [Podospora didyma]|uniref:Uncharacterized protein n=1 Tax=Podospora didyma TaxID=330526 RepID=A0AAE0N2B4_9PEZI|nr:hypothetical protein B0H63DRAFT_455091 [Podospora didyma]